MTPDKDQIKHASEEEDAACLSAMQLTSAVAVSMVMNAAIKLGVLEIIARAGTGAHLTASEIVSHLPTKNPDASLMLDRTLRLLASHSILTCSTCTLEDGQVERRFGLAPIGKFFVKDDDGLSLAPLLLFNQDKVIIESWYYLKDSIMEGEVAFDKAWGINGFEYLSKDSRYNKVFNTAMSAHASLTTKKVLEAYRAFEGLNSLVDLGGGIGMALNMIISKYPTIKGINFDLPYVIQEAPDYLGVTHVGGDMFVSVPSGDAIFVKSVLHNWSDEQCSILLKNCYEALPENGKMIVVELVVPVEPEANTLAKCVFEIDNVMLANTHGGKERTLEEFETLAKGAGFANVQVVCHACTSHVMEFLK